jgi:hypothetical protein
MRTSVTELTNILERVFYRLLLARCLYSLKMTVKLKIHKHIDLKIYQCHMGFYDYKIVVK